MKPMNIILIGAIIAILGGIITAFGTWKQNKNSSEKSTRIEDGVNKGNAEIINLRKENESLILLAKGQDQKIDNQSVLIDSLRKENIDLYTKLATSSLDIYNNLSGGDSYCYCFFMFSTYYASKDIGNLYCKLGNNNKHPLKDVQARIVDLNTFNFKNPTPVDFQKNIYSFGNIESNGAAVSLPNQFKVDKQKGVNLNIFFTANNGSFIQELRMKFINNEWISATVVKRNEKIIYKKIDEHYPEKDPDKIFKYTQ
jgi:hypothetical protein